jgi:hypothetical protein
VNKIPNKTTQSWWRWRSTAADRGNGTENPLEKILADLTEKHGRFIASYVKPISEIELLKSGKTLYAQLKELNACCQLFKEKINQLNQLWLMEQKTTSTLLDNLRHGHLGTTDETSAESYVLAFLKRHWGKLLIGSLGGGGPSLAVSMVLSLEPGYFAAFCLAGALFTGSAAAAAGMASDYLSSADQSNHDPDEVMLVPMGGQDGWQSEEESDAELLGPLVAITEIPDGNAKKQAADQTVSWSEWLLSSLSLWKKTAPAPQRPPTQTNERKDCELHAVRK